MMMLHAMLSLTLGPHFVLLSEGASGEKRDEDFIPPLSPPPPPPRLGSL